MIVISSIEMFLYICEFLGVEPKEFFDEETTSPTKLKEACEVLKTFTPKQLDLLISVAKEMN